MIRTLWEVPLSICFPANKIYHCFQFFELYTNITFFLQIYQIKNTDHPGTLWEVDPNLHIYILACAFVYNISAHMPEGIWADIFSLFPPIDAWRGRRIGLLNGYGGAICRQGNQAT